MCCCTLSLAAPFTLVCCGLWHWEVGCCSPCDEFNSIVFAVCFGSETLMIVKEGQIAVGQQQSRPLVHWRPQASSPWFSDSLKLFVNSLVGSYWVIVSWRCPCPMETPIFHSVLSHMSFRLVASDTSCGGLLSCTLLLGFWSSKARIWCRERCCWMASHLAKLLNLRCGLVFSLFLFVFPVKALFGSCFCDAADDLVFVGNNSGQVLFRSPFTLWFVVDSGIGGGCCTLGGELTSFCSSCVSETFMTVIE